MEKIKTALLSFGTSGQIFHAPFIKASKNFMLAGAWERSAKKLIESYPETISFNSFRQILDDASIELIVVNTPVYTHYEYAKAALEAGKHVIVEKAFTTSVAEAEALKALAENKQRTLAVYHNRRWDTDVQAVKKILERKVLGEIVEAEFHFDRFRPLLSPKTHKEDANPGSGLLFDLGPHLADRAIFFFGMPKAVFADIRITRQYSVVDDWFSMTLIYEKLRVRLKSSMLVKEPGPAFILHGRAGSFFKKMADPQEVQLMAGMRPSAADYGVEARGDEGTLSVENDRIEYVVSEQSSYMQFYEKMYRAVRMNEPVPVSAADGIAVMRILEAARRSNVSGKIESI